MKDVDLLCLGQRVGRYRISSYLGAGGFGTVYTAHDRCGSRVAIKVAHETVSALSTEELLAIQDEIELLQRLDHPSLVRVLAHGFLADGRIYMVMEHVQGETLAAYLKRHGRIEVIEALRLARKLCEAIAYCHSSDVLHCDLKPDNIMILPAHDPGIKVLDFGLARLSLGIELVHREQWAGTPGYMAPECYSGRRSSITPRADLFAIGAILHELLTGELPVRYRERDQAGPCATIGGRVALDSLPSEIPPDTVNLLESLLASSPDDRLEDAAKLGDWIHKLYYETLFNSAPGGSSDRADMPVPSPWNTPKDTRFVGRGEELKRVGALFEDAARGRSSATLLVGEAGIGKSRLVAEALQRVAASRDALIAYGRCRQLGEFITYSSLREALASLASALRAFPLDQRGSLRQALAGLHDEHAAVLQLLVPEFERMPRRGRGHRRGKLHWVAPQDVANAVLGLLACLTQVRPVALVLEDLLCADDGTLAVLQGVANSELAPGVVLLCTSRRSPSWQVTSKLFTTIQLSALSSIANHELLAALAGDADSSVVDALVQAVPLAKAGHPLVNVQIVRQLRTEHYLFVDEHGSIGLADRIRTDYRPPSSVGMAVERSFHGLSRASLGVLQVAALIDRQFRVSDVIGLGLFDSKEVEAAVQDGTRLRICWRAGDNVVFAHDTLRERLEHSISAERARGFHRRIAEQLSERGSADGTSAHHWACAGENLLAARSSTRAAKQAEARLDPMGAIGHLRRGFESLVSIAEEECDRDLLVYTVHELVRIACMLGNTDQTLEYVERCKSLLAPDEARAWHVMDSASARLYYVQGNFPMAVELSRRCLQRASSDPAMRRYRCVPTNIVGRALCATGKFGPAVQMLKDGCDLAERHEEPTELSHSHGMLSVALAFCGEFEQAKHHADVSADLAAELGSPVRMLGASFYYSVLAEACGDWGLGVRHSTQLLLDAEAQELSGLYVYVGTIFAGRHQFHVGALARARVLLENALELGRALDIKMGAGWAHAFLGDVAFVEGELAAARQQYLVALEIGQGASQEEYALGLSSLGLAHTSGLEGAEHETVEEHAQLGLASLHKVANRSALIVAYQRYAEALEAIGQRSEAQRLWMERSALAAELKLDAPDFWPESPQAVRDVSERRAYWLGRPVRRPATARGAPHVSTGGLLTPAATLREPKGGSSEVRHRSHARGSAEAGEPSARMNGLGGQRAREEDG